MKELAGEVLTAFGITLAFFVAMFNVVKIILLPQKRKIKEMAASFFVGWPVGFLVGWVCVDQIGDKWAIAVACLSVLLAEKIALFFMTIDPKKYMDRIINNLVDKWTK